MSTSQQWTLEKALEKKGMPVQSGRQPSSLGFFHLLENLKSTKRAGWVRNGISDCESIAAHSFRMMAMAEQLPQTIDKYRCMKMCMYHDLAESIIGDYTPSDRIPKAEKYKREEEAMQYITQTLVSSADGGSDIMSCWYEFEKRETEESLYANDLDKVDMIVQMFDYEKRGKGSINLEEFTRAANFVSKPETKAWIEEVLGRREEFWADKKKEHVDEEESENLKRLADEYYKE